jgi:arsenate reductase
MREIGLDMQDARPKDVAGFTAQSFGVVLTVCDNAKETCPVFSGSVGRRLHMGFDDPADATGNEEKVLAVFRRVRDEIRERMSALHRELTEGNKLP